MSYMPNMLAVPNVLLYFSVKGVYYSSSSPWACSKGCAVRFVPKSVLSSSRERKLRVRISDHLYLSLL